MESQKKTTRKKIYDDGDVVDMSKRTIALPKASAGNLQVGSWRFSLDGSRLSDASPAAISKITNVDVIILRLHLIYVCKAILDSVNGEIME